MSPNNYTHLEGVLISMEEFRLYNYNDYTRPIEEPDVKGSITVNVKKWFSEKQIIVPLKSRKGETYLFAKLPKGVQFPVKITVKVMFPKSKFEERYNFEFKEISRN